MGPRGGVTLVLWGCWARSQGEQLLPLVPGSRPCTLGSCCGTVGAPGPLYGGVSAPQAWPGHHMAPPHGQPTSVTAWQGPRLPRLRKARVPRRSLSAGPHWTLAEATVTHTCHRWGPGTRGTPPGEPDTDVAQCHSIHTKRPAKGQPRPEAGPWLGRWGAEALQQRDRRNLGGGGAPPCAR